MEVKGYESNRSSKPQCSSCLATCMGQGYQTWRSVESQLVKMEGSSHPITEGWNSIGQVLTFVAGVTPILEWGVWILPVCVCVFIKRELPGKQSTNDHQ